MHCIAFQSTYLTIEIGLLENTILLSTASIPKQDASRSFISTLHDLLNTQAVGIQQLSLCIVNRGPSPFTSLRTVIAYANGLHIATKIPLVGMDGLELLLQEYKGSDQTLVVLNAFATDIYFALLKMDGQILKGYAKTNELMALLKRECTTAPLTVVGNGIPLCKDALEHTFDQKSLILGNAEVGSCSINFLGASGYHAWESGATNDQPVLPLYLKNHQIF
jgi:tRNA threonylcarbamoyladenosine biosynthesis protein TsaB